MGFNSNNDYRYPYILNNHIVGFGDLVPTSTGGRLVMVTCSIFGTCITSLMVVTITNTLNMDNKERQAFLLLRRLASSKNMEKEGGKLISQIGVYGIRKGFISKDKKLRNLI